MKRIRFAIATVVDQVRDIALQVVGAVIGFILPETPEEWSVLAGMVLLSAWCLVDPGVPDPWAIAIPGVVYLALGLGFSLRRSR